MARSIHRTRRSLLDLEAADFSDDADKSQRHAEAWAELGEKWRIKYSVLEERHREPPPLRGTPTAAIPIEVLDEGPNALHAASPEDLRAILALLPEAATEGIARIQLSLGTAHVREHATDEDDERDPWFGRAGVLRVPGVYCAHVLGARSRSGLIRLVAFAWEPSQLALPRRAAELYLRLHALMTFVHEVAHHHDAIARVARGRWRSDHETNAERQAERMARAWTQEIVLPWLEKTFPEQVFELQAWVLETGGIELPLAFFAGDEPDTFMTTSSAFERWCRALPELTTSRDVRLELASDLRFADEFALSLRLLEQLRREIPADREVRGWIAGILNHLGRYGEALDVADSLLAEDPTDALAWSERASVFEARHEWEALIDTSRRWLRDVPTSKNSTRDALRCAAVASCALGRSDDAERIVDAFLGSALSPERRARNRFVMLRQIYRRAGRSLPEPAPPG